MWRSQVRNTGFNPRCDNLTGANHAFGGIHIEIENAVILNKTIFPYSTNISPKYRIQYPNVDWFETIFDCLKSNENISVKVWIMPKKEPVKVNYRCWLPRKYCNEEAPSGLRGSFISKWRNEECLQRNPQIGNNCSAKVFAGYQNITNFPCISKEIS